jgi:RHS repeat-associated protein
MLQPGRKFEAVNHYRYGFNGKENDNEVKGESNQQDYGMRIYDPRLGRFLSVDPLMPKYPELTPYQFASNRPIEGIDMDGLEFYKKNTILIEVGMNYDSKLQKITSATVTVSADNPNLNGPTANEIALYAKNNPKLGAFDITNNTIVFGRIEEDSKAESENPNGPLDKAVTKSTSGSQNNFAPFNPYDTRTTGTNTERLNKGKGILKLITAAAKFSSGIVKDDGIRAIKTQAQMAVTVFELLQDAITNGVDGVCIADNYLNKESLTSIARYLLYEKPIYKEDGKTENTELMNLGKRIYEIHMSKMKEMEDQKKQERLNELKNIGPRELPMRQ